MKPCCPDADHIKKESGSERESIWQVEEKSMRVQRMHLFGVKVEGGLLNLEQQL